MTELITLSQAAILADRSKTVVRRWVVEGFLELHQKVPGRNGAWLLDRDYFIATLPGLLELMDSRTGGQGRRELDGYGNERPLAPSRKSKTSTE